MKHDDSHLMWTPIHDELLCKARIFTLRTLRMQSPRGEEGSFVCAQAPDWVTIIPELQNDRGERSFLIVRQYRYGSAGVGMEFPAGMVEPGEDVHKAAARELLEETGHKAEELIPIGAVNPNPAFMTNTAHTFLARRLKKVADLNLDYHEILDVHRKPLSVIREQMGTHDYASAITVQAWYFYLRYVDGLKTDLP